MNPTFARETSRDAARGNESATPVREKPDAADEAHSSVIEAGHTRAYILYPSHPHMGGLHTGGGDSGCWDWAHARAYAPGPLTPIHGWPIRRQG